MTDDDRAEAGGEDEEAENGPGDEEERDRLLRSGAAVGVVLPDLGIRVADLDPERERADVEGDVRDARDSRPPVPASRQAGAMGL